MSGNGGKRSIEPWEVLKTEDVFSSPPWVRVSLHQVRLPDGRVIDRYYQVALQDFVVVAQAAGGRIVLERQYRHGVRNVILALPAGTREGGEDPLACARRELLEETGYASEDWRALGQFVGNGTYGCGTGHVFLARDARKVAAPVGGDLEDMEILLLTPTEVAGTVKNGEMATMSSVAAFALATNPLLQGSWGRGDAAGDDSNTRVR